MSSNLPKEWLGFESRDVGLLHEAGFVFVGYVHLHWTADVIQTLMIWHIDPEKDADFPANCHLRYSFYPPEGPRGWTFNHDDDGRRASFTYPSFGELLGYWRTTAQRFRDAL